MSLKLTDVPISSRKVRAQMVQAAAVPTAVSAAPATRPPVTKSGLSSQNHRGNLSGLVLGCIEADFVFAIKHVYINCIHLAACFPIYNICILLHRSTFESCIMFNTIACFCKFSAMLFFILQNIVEFEFLSE